MSRVVSWAAGSARTGLAHFSEEHWKLKNNSVAKSPSMNSLESAS